MYKAKQQDVFKIVVGTISSRRPNQRFHGDYVFSEPNQKVKSTEQTWVFNDKVLGPWANWFSALGNLRRLAVADFYGIFQDDIIVLDNWQEYLSGHSYLPPAFSIYTPDDYISRDWCKWCWFPIYEGRGLKMAQTYFFSAQIVDELLADDKVHSFYGNINIDNRVGDFLGRKKIPMEFHQPSLAQHLDGPSTIWPDGKETRFASSFNKDYKL